MSDRSSQPVPWWRHALAALLGTAPSIPASRDISTFDVTTFDVTTADTCLEDPVAVESALDSEHPR